MNHDDYAESYGNFVVLGSPEVSKGVGMNSPELQGITAGEFIKGLTVTGDAEEGTKDEEIADLKSQLENYEMLHKTQREHIMRLEGIIVKHLNNNSAFQVEVEKMLRVIPGTDCEDRSNGCSCKYCKSYRELVWATKCQAAWFWNMCREKVPLVKNDKCICDK